MSALEIARKQKEENRLQKELLEAENKRKTEEAQEYLKKERERISAKKERLKEWANIENVENFADKVLFEFDGVENIIYLSDEKRLFKGGDILAAVNILKANDSETGINYFNIRLMMPKYPSNHERKALYLNTFNPDKFEEEFGKLMAEHI